MAKFIPDQNLYSEQKSSSTFYYSLDKFTTEQIMTALAKRKEKKKLVQDEVEKILFDVEIYPNSILRCTEIQNILNYFFEISQHNGWAFPVEEMADPVHFIHTVIFSLIPKHLEYFEKVGDTAMETYFNQFILGERYSCAFKTKPRQGEIVSAKTGVLEGVHTQQKARSNDVLKVISNENGLIDVVDYVKSIFKQSGIEMSLPSKYVSDVFEAVVGAVKLALVDKSAVFNAWFHAFAFKNIELRWDDVESKKYKSQLNEILQQLQQQYVEFQQEQFGRTDAVKDVSILTDNVVSFERKGKKNLFVIHCILNDKLTKMNRFPLIAGGNCTIQYIMQYRTDLWISNDRKNGFKSASHTYVNEHGEKQFPAKFGGRFYSVWNMLDIKPLNTFRENGKNVKPFHLNFGELSGTIPHRDHIAKLLTQSGGKITVPIVPGGIFYPARNPRDGEVFKQGDEVKKGEVFGYIIPPVIPHTRKFGTIRSSACGASKQEAAELAAMSVLALYGNQLSTMANVSYDVEKAKRDYAKQVAYAKQKAMRAAHKKDLVNGFGATGFQQKKERKQRHSNNQRNSKKTSPRRRKY